jgi:hypothetical protein
MTDIILAAIGLVSFLLAVFGSIYLSKKNSDSIGKEEEIIKLLREEKVSTNRKFHKKRKSVPGIVFKLNSDNTDLIYQTAREKKLSVGELLLAARINSLK